MVRIVTETKEEQTATGRIHKTCFPIIEIPSQSHLLPLMLLFGTLT
jgi:hypothetical protein